MKHILFLFTMVMFFSTRSYCQAKAATPGSVHAGPKSANSPGGLPQRAIGDIAPDFLQYDINDKPVHLSDFKGKYVLLDFWGPFCAPCRKEHPLFVQLYDQYRAKNFTIVGVSVNYGPVTKKQWLDAIAQDKLEWTNVSAPEFMNGKRPVKKFNEAAAKYGVAGLPRNFLIDASGKIIAMDLRGDALSKKLAEVLK